MAEGARGVAHAAGDIDSQRAALMDRLEATTSLLGNGALPLGLVEKHMDEWVEEQK